MGLHYKVYSFGYHEHDESIELLNALSYEKKRLCFEILSTNPQTLPRKIFYIMVNQRPDITFIPDDDIVIKIRNIKQNNK